MKKLSLLFSFLLIICSLKAQYSNKYLNKEEMVQALEYLGMYLYKIPVVSDSTYNFNLLFQEYNNGKCVDSARLLDEKNLKMLKDFGLSLKINKDTSFLKIFAQKKEDGLFKITYSYPSYQSFKDIKVPEKYGEHMLREFAAPEITGPGKYPVLMLSASWEQTIGGQKIRRFCFPEDVDQIKKLVEHFYVFSVVAD